MNLDLSQWTNFGHVKDWWCHISGAHGQRRKGLSSLIFLTVWELWDERNARVFKNEASMPSSILSKIKGSSLGNRRGKSFECYFIARVGFCWERRSL
jgi:hypothetical protein